MRVTPPIPVTHVPLPTWRLSDPTTRLPRVCPNGRGHLLEAEWPMASDNGAAKNRVAGLLSCVTCGHTLGWLS